MQAGRLPSGVRGDTSPRPTVWTPSPACLARVGLLVLLSLAAAVQLSTASEGSPFGRRLLLETRPPPGDHPSPHPGVSQAPIRSSNGISKDGSSSGSTSSNKNGGSDGGNSSGRRREHAGAKAGSQGGTREPQAKKLPEAIGVAGKKAAFPSVPSQGRKDSALLGISSKSFLVEKDRYGHTELTVGNAPKPAAGPYAPAHAGDEVHTLKDHANKQVKHTARQNRGTGAVGGRGAADALSQRLAIANAAASTWQDPLYVALCLVAKDEHASIREWVLYHRRIGVGRIYVYDHGSSPPMRNELADFIEAGLVDYQLVQGLMPGMEHGDRPQIAMYNDCLRRCAGSQHAWVGAIDADEFVMIMDGSPSLPAVLHDYEAYGGLVVNWRAFGSSGHLTRPHAGVLGSYTACTPVSFPENVHVKSFVQPERVKQAGWSPHHFDFKEGFFAVNTNFSRTEGPWAEPPVGDRLLIHHYVLRSAAEFEAKLAKGSAMGSDRV
ncbi:hypothetical protein N2152v2_000828 [Parachlorella kessleri]